MLNSFKLAGTRQKMKHTRFSSPATASLEISHRKPRKPGTVSGSYLTSPHFQDSSSERLELNSKLTGWHCFVNRAALASVACNQV